MIRIIAAAAMFIHAAVAGSAVAQSEAPVRIGVLNDQNGLFSDLAGSGSVVAARMAVEDFGGRVLGRPIEVLVADHQNKPDVGAAIARQWYDVEGVGAIVDIPVSSVGLAVQQIARERRRIVMFSGSTSSDLIGRACSPTGFQWTFNTVSAARGTASAVLRNGGDTWFFIAADYAFGRALQRDASAVIDAGKGKVLGAVWHPINTSDFASYLLQAQSSRSKVVALATSGSDLINLIKQSDEFGLKSGQQSVVSLQTFITDIHSLGLAKAQGLILTTAFYWDADEGTRAWSRRFAALNRGRMPTMVQAGVYGAVSHYLKALSAAVGTEAGTAVAAKMRELPVQDFMTNGARIRKDGWVLRDFDLVQVKSPEESKGPWDYYRILRHISAEEAAPPEADRCDGP